MLRQRGRCGRQSTHTLPPAQVDLEGEEQLAAVEAAIAAINPTARRLRTHRCDVDVGAILDLRALAGDRCARPCAVREWCAC